MMSFIFEYAIRNRLKIKFLYNLHEIILDPYEIGINNLVNKSVIGRNQNEDEIKEYEYYKIVNIKILTKHFIPRNPLAANYWKKAEEIC